MVDVGIYCPWWDVSIYYKR